MSHQSPCKSRSEMFLFCSSSEPSSSISGCFPSYRAATLSGSDQGVPSVTCRDLFQSKRGSEVINFCFLGEKERDGARACCAWEEGCDLTPVHLAQYLLPATALSWRCFCSQARLVLRQYLMLLPVGLTPSWPLSLMGQASPRQLGALQSPSHPHMGAHHRVPTSRRPPPRCTSPSWTRTTTPPPSSSSSTR